MLLDLSAAFDTVDHTVLVDRLENCVGLSGTVLSWFRSYLQHRNYFVSIGDFVPEQTNVTCGAPQGRGSILGPSLFMPKRIMQKKCIYAKTKDSDLHFNVST